MFEDYQRSFVTAKICPAFYKSDKRAVAKKEGYKIPDIDGLTLDLAQVNFILVSEHENLNGDYFSREELLKSYSTPLHKPFDIEHTISEDESYISQPYFNRTKNTIVGHMVYSSLATKDGKILSEKEINKLDKKDDPSRANEDCLDIVCSAFLYDFLFPKTVADIIELSEKEKMFVSMEVWFKGNDFLVNGKIVEKTAENSKELTEAWSRGFKGEDGKRICRVLRNIIFGGVAATPTPANPESVFITVANLEQELAHLVKRHTELHILQSVSPKEEYKIEHDMIEKSAASLRKKIQESKNG